MFDHTSRYADLETVTLMTEDGRTATYVRRRFPPPEDAFQIVAEVTVNDPDRLDLIAARTVGAAEQFWRIADANAVLNPFDLTATPGERVRIPAPGM
ncbi:MAG: hypothetical protein NZ553_15485 [Caldilinea sp.]|nr:hypothetical protein [Caldilinea sp.]MDW8441877.1 hypothetical protein [Caldilineaceae bacterium]